LIVAVLSCFDRVIFKGHLPIGNGTRRLRRLRPWAERVGSRVRRRKGSSDAA
jgi:hypothetical protein